MRKTERGAWNVTEETRTAKPLEKTLPETGSEDRRVETTVLRNQGTMPVAAPGVNVESEVSGSLNEFGLLDGTVRTTTHKPKKVQTKGGTASRTVEVETAINESEPKQENPEENVEVEVTARPNGHGSVDYTKRKVTFKKETGNTQTENPMSSETRVVTTNETEKNVRESAARGEVKEVAISLNEHGSATVQKVTRKAKKDSNTTEWNTNDGNYTYHHIVKVFRNHEKIPTIPDNAYQMSVSVSINEYGLLDGVISGVKSRVGNNGGTGGGSQADNRFKITGNATFRRANGKFYRQNFSAECRYLRSTVDNMAAAVAGGESETTVGWISGIKGSYALIYKNIKKEGDPVEYYG